VHAEQWALLDAGPQAYGRELMHLKAVNGLLVASGPPSCVQCSKLILAAGVEGVWLFRPDALWHRYTATEFHQLSLANDNVLAALRRADDLSRLGQATGASPWT
jgi:deoxycytidylate deaminase